MRPWIENCSQKDAERILLGPSPSNTVCISITESADAPLKANFDDILRLKFADADDERSSVALMEAILGPNWEKALFSEAQAKEVVDFVTKHRGKNILVHCHAGISRSRAVNETICEAFPEYNDVTMPAQRFPNNRVKRLLKRAFRLTPIGAE